MSEYSDIQQWFTALAVLPCTAICILMYRYAKARLPGTQSTQYKRMRYWYCALAGGTTGLFFCHTLRKSLIDSSTLSESSSLWGGYNTMIGLVLVTFFIVWLINRYKLVSNPNPGHIIFDYTTEPEYSIDRESMTDQTYLESDDVTTKEYAIRSYTVMDEKVLKSIRRRTSFSFYVVMLILMAIEGMYLVYRQDVAVGGPLTLIVCWWIDNIAKTIIVCAILIHGNWHTLEDGKHRWLWVLCAVWCLTILLATIPVLAQCSTETIRTKVDFPFTSIVHACAGGFLFYIALYYTMFTRNAMSKRDLCVQLTIWISSCLIFYMTGIFV